MADDIRPVFGALAAESGSRYAMGRSGYTPGMFVSSGESRDAAAVRSHMRDMDRLAGGQTVGLSGGQMEMYVRKARALTQHLPGGINAYADRVDYGARLADISGLNPTFGAQTAYNATAFGEAFGALGGNQGFGGLSKDEAIALDQQLRTTAAGSPMANALGALMAMDENGLVGHGPNAKPARDIINAIQDKDQTKLNMLSKMSPGQLLQVLKASGVDPATANTFLQSRKANQQQISKYSIGDLTRGMQRDAEVGSFMTNNLASGMSGVLGRAGFDKGSVEKLAPQAAEAARQALMGMDPDTMNDPVKRNAAVSAAVKGAIGEEAANRLGPEKLNELSATSIRNLEGAIGRSKSFGKYKNLQGLVSMNRGDIQSDANSRMSKARADAEISSLAASQGGAGLGKAVDAALAAGDDSKLTDVISSALGGTNANLLSQALTPGMKLLRSNAAEMKKLQDELGETKDPGRRTEIEGKLNELRESSKQTTARMKTAAGDRFSARAAGPAGGAGSQVSTGPDGAGGPLQITGTLVLKPDGTADINAGGTRAGDAPAP